ncbi:hypothetical protein Ahy_A10g048481 [Arachis hypogaea]|uniref:Aminotransferase-like plant mobile domain-containing protein n=1 Tax=Arachis hypogaea TaxID=3818 RepID=A0A445B580_ARAHY|nr:hypothetical protein Ahy_A10g048481 [Arachis hypogaea]
MDEPLILLFVWAWEHMRSWRLFPAMSSSMWSHWCRFTRYTRRSMTQFRRQFDDMGVNDFIWRPYMAVVVPDDLAINLFMCSTKSSLVSFECIEWHPTEQIRRQFMLQQAQPDPTFDIGDDHCRRLTGPQNHDWRDKNSECVNMWNSGRYNTIQLGDEIVDFHPLSIYYEWYT